MPLVISCRGFAFFFRVLLLVMASLGLSSSVWAAANVVMASSGFTPADSARTYMDVGAVWNGSSRIDPGDGDVFTVTYTNNGDATAFDFSPQLTLPAGFTRVGAASVTATSGTPAITNTPATTGTILFNLGGFDVPVGASLTLTFRLKTETTVGTGTQQFTHGWTWAATNGGAQNALTTGLQNVIVRAGAYVVAVSPGTMTLAVNQSGTFTYTVKNTGLGGLFNLSLNESSSDPGTAWDFQNFGAITAPRVTTTAGAVVTIPYLAPGESLTVPVLGKVTNCIDINNTLVTNHLAATSATNWTNPVTLDLEVPLVDYTASNITLNYSAPTAVSIPFINNGAGAARGVDVGGGTRRIRFTTNFPALGVVISNVAANWTYDAGTGVFSYAGNSATLGGGQSTTLTFDLRPANYCAPASGSILYGMQYEDMCGHPYNIPAKFAALNPSATVPSVSLTKTGTADRLVVGYAASWTVTLSAQNTSLISGTNIVVTDNLPAGLTAIVLTTSAGTATRSGNTITWTVPKSSLGSSQTLKVDFNAPSNACDGGLTITNTASVSGLTSTAGCALTATASHSILLTNNPNAVLYQNFEVTDAPDGTYETGSASANAVQDNGEGEFIPCLATYTIGAGYPGNWAGSTYNDNFGGVTQLTLVPGTLEVSVDGGGTFTAVPGASVTGGTGSFTIDLGFLAGVSYFNTPTASHPTNNRDLRFRYKCTAPDAALGAGTTRGVTQLTKLTLANGAGPGACNTGSFTQGDFYSLARAAGSLALAMPTSIGTCDTFPLTITVGNATPERISNVLITLNTQVASGDYGYVLGQTPVYGGAFNSGNITVTENAGTFPTFRYTGGDLAGNGTITVNVLRRGTSTTTSAVTATLAYDDNETNPTTGTREFSAHASTSPSLVRQANLQLLITPQTVVIYGATVTWTVYVTNGGTGPAFVTELLDTFPTNVVPDIPAMVAANAGIGLVAGDIAVAGADVTLQLHSIASGQTKKVVIIGNVTGGGCNFTSVANAIKVRWGCSGGYIQNQQQANPIFIQPAPQVDVSHEIVNSFAELCGTGVIEVVVRNVGNTQINTVKINEVINTATSGLTFVPGSVRYALNNGAFNSPSASYNPGSGSGTTASPYVWTSAQIPELASLVSANNAGTNMVRLRFDVAVDELANGSGTPVSTTVDYRNPCGDPYTKAGSVFTVPLRRPNITVVKAGINRTVAGGTPRTGTFGATVLAGQGDAVEWRVQITNNGNFVARNVRLKDDLAGSGGPVILTNSSGGTTAPLGAYTSGAWVTLPDIPASSTVTYYFNETVGSTCVNALNTATVTWGCVNNGATAASNLTSPTNNVATARLNTVPSVAASVTNIVNTGTAAENGRYSHQVRLTNTGGHAADVAYTLTLPASVDLDPSWTPLNTLITAATKFTTTDTGATHPAATRYSGFTITGSHPTYTVTFSGTGPGQVHLRSGTYVAATLYYLPRDYPDTTANPATPTMAQIASFASPETTANGLDPTVLASAAATITPTYATTCGNTFTGTPVNSTLDVRTPDLDITVLPTPEQISAETAPYTFVFSYAITNNGETSSTANHIRFRLSSVGSDWASVSVALVIPGTGGSAITTTNAANNYLIDEANLGRLLPGQSATVEVTVTTVNPSGGPPVNRPSSANLMLVGEVEGSLYNQGPTTATGDDADTGVNYSLDRAAPLIFDKFTVAGYLYNDANHNAQREQTGETGIGGTYYAKMIAVGSSTAYAAVAISGTTGYYEFTGAIPTGDYVIIVDDNNSLGDITPATTGTIVARVGTEMPTLQRPVHIGVTSIIDQNFGRYNGSRYTGVVFSDTGAGGGTANNGSLDGGESGIADVIVRATTNAGTTTLDTTTTEADGSYTLWVPATAGTPFKIVETNIANYRSTGASYPAGGSYTIGTDTISMPFASGATLSGFNFGDVPPATFTADGAHSIVAGASTVYAHVFTVGTAGKVSFGTTATATPATYTWTHLLYLDPNCNGALDPGETTIVLPGTEYPVVAGQQICLLLKQNSPAGGSYGISNQVVIPATFTALRGATVVFSGPAITNTDTTTIGTQVAGGLELTKEQVLDANCDAAETVGFGIAPITTGAVPGACVKYRLTYRNNGNDPLSSIDIYDTTPAFTTFVSATADTPPINLNATVTITKPSVGTAGDIHWIFTGTLAPGASGTVYFTVKVRQ